MRLNGELKRVTIVVVQQKKCRGAGLSSFIIQFIGINLDHCILFHSNHVQMWTSQAILECGWCSYAYAMYLEPFLYFSILSTITFDDISANFGLLRELTNPSCTSH